MDENPPFSNKIYTFTMDLPTCCASLLESIRWNATLLVTVTKGMIKGWSHCSKCLANVIFDCWNYTGVSWTSARTLILLEDCPTKPVTKKDHPATVIPVTRLSQQRKRRARPSLAVQPIPKLNWQRSCQNKKQTNHTKTAITTKITCQWFKVITLLPYS